MKIVKEKKDVVDFLVDYCGFDEEKAMSLCTEYNTVIEENVGKPIHEVVDLLLAFQEDEEIEDTEEEEFEEDEDWDEEEEDDWDDDSDEFDDEEDE